MSKLIDIQDAWDDAAAAMNAVFVAFDYIEEAKQSASERDYSALNTAFGMLMKQAASTLEQCDIRIGKAMSPNADKPQYSEKTLVVDFGMDGDEQSMGSSFSDIPEAYQNEIPTFLLKAGGTD